MKFTFALLLAAGLLAWTAATQEPPKPNEPKLPEPEPKLVKPEGRPLIKVIQPKDRPTISEEQLKKAVSTDHEVRAAFAELVLAQANLEVAKNQASQRITDLQFSIEEQRAIVAGLKIQVQSAEEIFKATEELFQATERRYKSPQGQLASKAEVLQEGQTVATRRAELAAVRAELEAAQARLGRLESQWKQVIDRADKPSPLPVPVPFRNE